MTPPTASVEKARLSTTATSSIEVVYRSTKGLSSVPIRGIVSGVRAATVHKATASPVIVGLGSALLLVLLGLTSAIGGTFRTIQVVQDLGPLRPAAQATLLPGGTTLAHARAASALPLPSSRTLAEGWVMQRVEVQKSAGEWIQLVYTRDRAVFRVWVSALADRPVISTLGVRSESVTVLGRPVLLLFGDSGPVNAPPEGAALSLGEPAHRLRAVFEHGNSMVVLLADDRSLASSSLLSIVEAWMNSAR